MRDLCESHVVHIYRAAHQEVGILGKRIGPLIGDANSSAIWIGTTVGIGLRHVARDVRFGSLAVIPPNDSLTSAFERIAVVQPARSGLPSLNVRFTQ